MNTQETKTPGRGWFKAGAIGLIVFGGVHLFAVYHGLAEKPSTAEEVACEKAMLALRFDMGPFHSTAWHTDMILNASFSALLIYSGIINLMALHGIVAAGRLCAVAALNASLCFTLVIFCLLGRFPPPIVFAGGCSLLFGIAFLRGSAGARI